MGNAVCGFKNFHYCLRTANAVPVPMPGAVRLTREPQMNEIKIVPNAVGAPEEYVIGHREGVIRLGLEVVSLPQSFLTDGLGYTIDANGVLVENGHPVVHFALLYETQSTDSGAARHCYYDCVCKKPKYDVTTLSGSSRFDTRTLEIIANRDIFGTGAFKKSVGEASTATFAAWFNSLY